MLETNSKEYVKAIYLRGITLIAQLIGESVLHYLHNAHGDVVQQVSSSGDSAPVYEYDAFGNQKEPSGDDPNPFRYCGEYFDKETEEVYLRNRYYDSRTGRFGQEDIYYTAIMMMDGKESIEPISLNPYIYTHNDPIQFIDNSGRQVALTLSSLALSFGLLVKSAAALGTAIVGFLSSPVGLILLAVAVVALTIIYFSKRHKKKKQDAKDDRLYGEPGEVNVTNSNNDDDGKNYKRETKFGDDRLAEIERHHTDHGTPNQHTNPHDHRIDWNNGSPNFSSPINYPNGNIPTLGGLFSPETLMLTGHWYLVDDVYNRKVAGPFFTQFDALSARPKGSSRIYTIVYEKN